MFSACGPTLCELAVQALSSTERGYDLLAPKFDHTPFRTPEPVLRAVEDTLRPLAPVRTGLDLCCGTGAGVGVLRRLCAERVVGVDVSAAMLAVARRTYAAGDPPSATQWIRADARALPFTAAFDLITCHGAFGHFLPAERPALFADIHRALRPGGRFAFPVAAPPPLGSAAYWVLWGFDTVMRVRNALWHPPFIMYYRTFRLFEVRAELRDAGFSVETPALPELGERRDGSPQFRLVTAHRR